MSSDSTAKRSPGLAEDPGRFFERELARTGRGTKIRLVFWSLCLVLMTVGLIGLYRWVDGYVEYPSWAGQRLEDELGKRLPYLVDDAARAASKEAGAKMDMQVGKWIKNLPRVRKNAAREGGTFVKELSTAVGEDLDAMLDEAFAGEEGEALARLVTDGANGGEARDEAVEAVASALAQRMLERTQHAPRWKAVDILVATSGKVERMERDEALTLEEALEAELLRTFGRIVWGRPNP